MMYIRSTLFLLLAAISLTGWGGLVFPRSGSWTRRFGAGTLLMFFIVSAAGWAGLLSGGVTWAVLLAGTLLCLLPGDARIPRGAVWLGLAGLLVLPLALLPPISRDAMSHHLLLPRIWLADGIITRPEWSRFFSYPYLVETLYSVGGGTFGFDSSRVVSLLGFLAACAVPVEHYLRKGSRKTAVLALLMLVSIPELFRNASWSYSDSFLVFFSLLAFSELLKKDGSPVLAVLWAGGAACCKYNGIPVLAVTIVTLPLVFGKRSLRTWTACGLAAVITSGWWMVPNLLQWGNPVYPLMQGLFGPASDVISSRGAAYLAFNRFTPAVSGVTDYLLLPVRMSIYGRWDDASLFDGASGPLLLGGTLLAVAMVRGRRRKLLLPMAILVLAVAFSGSAVRTRYLLPGLAMLALPAAEAVSRALTAGGRAVRTVVVSLMAICLIWSAVTVSELYRIERPWSLPGREEYLEANTDYYAFFMECSTSVSPSDTALMVNIERPFYFPGYAVTGRSRVPRELLELFWAGASAADVADTLRSMGVTMLAMDMVYTTLNLLPELKGDELGHWREFTADHLEPRVTNGRYVLFRLRGES